MHLSLDAKAELVFFYPWSSDPEGPDGSALDSHSWQDHHFPVTQQFNFNFNLNMETNRQQKVC